MPINIQGLIAGLRAAWRRLPRGRRPRRAALEPLEPRQLLAADLLINEWMASNHRTLLDGRGEAPDWIEIFNAGNQVVDLEGWSLTDDPNDLSKWSFPSLFLQPGAYLITFASGRDIANDSYRILRDLHTTPDGTFLVDLPPGTYDVRLTMGDATRERDLVAVYLQGTQVDFLSTAAGEFASRTYTGEVAGGEGPGQLALRLEDRGGIRARAAINGLVIRPHGGGDALRFDFGTDDSPVEPTYRRVAPDAFYDPAAGFGWAAGTVIGAPDRPLERDEPHTNFKLDAGGGFLALVAPDATIADRFGSADQPYPAQYPDVAYGRVEIDGQQRLGYLATPTPGAANEPAGAVIGPRIGQVTENPGAIDDDEDLVIEATVEANAAPVAWVQLVYRRMFEEEQTLPMVDDGSGADAVAGDGIFTAVIPHTFSEPGQMVRWAVTAVDTAGRGNRAPLFPKGPLADAPLARLLRDAPEYFGTIVADPQVVTDLPVLYWFVEEPLRAGGSAGTRASLYFDGEFYDNIQVDGHGQSTQAFPKKSFDFDFNAGRKFRFSENAGRVSDFNLLTNYADKTKVRNTLAYEVYQNAGHATHAAFPIRVEQNGDFYGVFDWVEEGDAEYLARNGLDPNGALYKVNNRLNSATTNVEKRTRKYEDRADLQALVDATRLGPAEKNAWFLDNLDLAGWVNFLAAMVVTGNIDCCFKNYYLYRDSEGTGQWQILPWDQDLSFGHNWNSTETYFDEDLIYDTDVGGRDGTNDVIGRYHGETGLYGIPGFKDMVLRRLRTLMDQQLQAPDTPAEELAFESRIDALIEQIGDDALLDQNRWGFPARFTPQTPRQAADDLKAFYFPARRSFLYDLPELPPAQEADAQIEIARIEADPSSGNLAEQYVELRNRGDEAVDISGWRLAGDIDFIFRGGTVIPAGQSLYVAADLQAFLARQEGPRGGQGLFVQGNFSGRIAAEQPDVRLAASADNRSAHQSDLRITEINYHPHNPRAEQGERDADDDAFEFIELTNIGHAPLNLSGVALTDGVRFTFGDLVLGGGQSTVVVRDREGFLSRYGDAAISVAGEFEAGKLSNRGERIRLEDPQHRLIAEVAYADRAPWPDVADGRGSTLEVIDVQGDASDPRNWRASARVGGSPGTYPENARPDVIINEVLAGSATPTADQIELYNTTGQSIDVSGWTLAVDPDDPARGRLPEGTTIAAGAYLVVDTSDLGLPIDRTRGGRIWLNETDAAGQPVRFADAVRFGAVPAGTSVGRTDGAPNGETLVPLEEPSPAAANASPVDGGVILSEVHFDPQPLPLVEEAFALDRGALTPVRGNWQVQSGHYVVVPGVEGDTAALLDDFQLPASGVRITTSIRIPSNTSFFRNGAILFDYRGADDFKFATIHPKKGRWRIGQRTSEGWRFLATLDRSIEATIDQVMRVELRGSVATLSAANGVALSYDFGTPLTAGRIGLGSRNGEARFDFLKVMALADRQDFEFVELRNTTDRPIDLSAWRVSGGIETTFPEGTAIKPGRPLVLVSFDPADAAAASEFRRVYGIDETVPLSGPFTGRLADTGDRIELLRPIASGQGASVMQLVDRVDFRTTPPWPTAARADGDALHRSAAARPLRSGAGDWHVGPPTPGVAAPLPKRGDMNGDGRVDQYDLQIFVQALLDPQQYESLYGIPAATAGDFDGDGDLDYDDIEGLVQRLRPDVRGGGR